MTRTIDRDELAAFMAELADDLNREFGITEAIIAVVLPNESTYEVVYSTDDNQDEIQTMLAALHNSAVRLVNKLHGKEEEESDANRLN